MADISQLHKQGTELFTKRMQLLTLWQAIADHFYPERADFTVIRNLGREFASNLMTSYPVMVRRDLGDSIGSMLRPTSKEWKHIRTRDWDNVGRDGRAWLERCTGIMNRAMEDRRSGFARATKEGDHDFAAFGQCVLQITLNSKANGLLYRAWHLRDVAWRENDEGFVDTVYRKWKPDALHLKALFGDKVSQKVKDVISNGKPYEEFEIWHIVIPTENYSPAGAKKFRTPFVSIYYDVAAEHIIEEVGLLENEYIIPRWSTVSGYQYAFSPATVCGLPDARLIQAMTRTILEAGEKAVTPPMIAVEEMVKSDLAVYAGGVTWVDADYDERLGEVLRPMTMNLSGMPIGLEILKDIREMIGQAFYLNRLNLPQPGTEMTAFEVGQRVQEYIRQAMPLFSPMETEYNAPMCERTFNLLLRNGAFGSPYDMPPELRGQKIEFFFESPLHDATEREKGQRLLEMVSMISQVASFDQNSVLLADFPTALRDVLGGIGVPAKWTRSEDDVKKLAAEKQQQQQTAELLANLNQGSQVAKNLSDAGLAGNTTVTRQNDNTTPPPAGV